MKESPHAINLRDIESIVKATNTLWFSLKLGIFSDYLGFAKWYAMWRALRMVNAVDKYRLEFIHIDGTDLQPFSGLGIGTEYKCETM